MANYSFEWDICQLPTNFGTVTAIMKRFIERLACYACWPWGKPALLARLFTPIVGLLKKAAAALGGRIVGVLFVGLAAQQLEPALPRRTVAKARRMGRKLVAAAGK